MSDQLQFARTPTLDIGYEESGPRGGDPVLLLHGFPYDIRQFDLLRAGLKSSGLRVIVPYLRGFGPTRYVSAEIMRSGQQAALGKDILDLMDSLQIERAILVGYNWGGRGACVASALWPERVSGLISIGGYTIQDIAKSANTPELPEQEHQYWYQWYFHTERGRLGLERNRVEICRLLWKMWSPGWSFSHHEFTITAKSFGNPDFVATVVQSYRHRYGNAPGDPSLESLEMRLGEQPKITVPTIVLHGEQDRVEPPSTSEGHSQFFTSYYERRVIPAAGHCPPAEAPSDVIEAIRDLMFVMTEK